MPATQFLPTEANLDAVISEYRAFRAAVDRLSDRIFRLFDDRTLAIASTRLGMLDPRTIHSRSDNEMAVLMDYAMYEVRIDGKNALERYLEKAPPADDSTESGFLQAMLDSQYAAVLLEERVSGLGFLVRDILTDERHLLVDLNLATSGKPGLMLLTRLYFHAGYCCTGGAPMLLGEIDPSQADNTVLDLQRSLRRKPAGRMDFGPLIAPLLKAGAARAVETKNIEVEAADFDEPEPYRPRESYSAPERLEPYRAPAATIGRNERCPCGSGRKFKQCCLRKPK